MPYVVTVALIGITVNILAIGALLFARKCRWSVTAIAQAQGLLNAGFAGGNNGMGGPTTITWIVTIIGFVYCLVAVADSYRTYNPNPSR